MNLIIPPVTVFANQQTARFWIGTRWMTVGEMKEIRVDELEMLAGNNGTAQLAFQVTNDPMSPPNATTFTALGNSRNSDGMSSPSGWTDYTATIASQKLIRFGYAFQATAVADAWARLAGAISITKRC